MVGGAAGVLVMEAGVQGLGLLELGVQDVKVSCTQFTDRVSGFRPCPGVPLVHGMFQGLVKAHSSHGFYPAVSESRVILPEELLSFLLGVAGYRRPKHRP